MGRRRSLLRSLARRFGYDLRLRSDLVQQADPFDAQATLLTGRPVDRIFDVTEFADPFFPISILGVGTDAGGRIPLDFANQPGKVLTSQQGDPIIARLDSARLQEIADLTGVAYAGVTDMS